MLACDIVGALVCLHRARALRAGGTGVEAGTEWRYDLALRLAGPDGAGHAHVPLILCHRGTAEHHDEGLERVAVERALATWEWTATRVERAASGRRRMRRPIAGEPLVEIIVPFRDRGDMLERCVRSVLARSSYDRLSLRLVDNGSVEPALPALLAELERDARVTVVADPRPFNFSALNNAAAAASQADFLVFLNSDTEVVTQSWIEDLLEEAGQPQVGAVAPLLTYPDGTVQHAGAALGMHGYAGHPFAGLAPDQPTPFGTAIDGTRNWLAVTAACMMVQRSKFASVGGFDETFVVAGNDVDLCLRLTGAGHRSLCLPHVRVHHDEARSRGSYIAPGDHARSEQAYGEYRTVGDPFYNPNLTLAATDCGMRRPGEPPS